MISHHAGFVEGEKVLKDLYDNKGRRRKKFK